MRIVREGFLVGEVPLILLLKRRKVVFVNYHIILDGFVSIFFLIDEFFHHGSQLRDLRLIFVYFCQNLGN